MNGRRIFLKSTVAASLAAMGWLSLKTVSNDSGIVPHSAPFIIDGEIPSGFSIYGSVAVYRSGSNLKVYSAFCTHLGCKINTIDNSQLLCPCHGSRFNPDGTVATGPATKSLIELRHYFKNGKLNVILDDYAGKN